MDLEAHLANPDALRTATARAHRDRDAVTSPLLEDAREKVAEDITQFHEQWQKVERIARNIDRVDGLLLDAPTHVRAHRDAILAELPTARAFRARISEDLTAAGLASILPESGGNGEG